MHSVERDLTADAVKTADRATESEIDSVTAWLDHGEVLAAAKAKYGYGGFGEWWTAMQAGLARPYSEQWRAVVLRADRRVVSEGRPEIKPSLNSSERFNIKKWADGGTGWPDEVGDEDDDAPPAPEHGSDEWFTPGWLFHALGLDFDVDTCSPVDRTYVSVPARHWYTEADDGLAQQWDGLAWCNPPYSSAAPWAAKMIEHGEGLLLTHVPINGGWCLDVWRSCDRLTLFQGMHFVRPDGETQRPAWWLQLAAFGDRATAALDNLHERIPSDLDPRWRPGPIWGADR